jgi:ribonuclease P protein component
MAKTNTYPREARLLKTTEFEAVFAQSERFHSPNFRLSIKLNPDLARPRLGFVVSKRVDKRAVQRNRLKRVLREMFRQQRAGLRLGDWLFSVKPGASALENSALRAEIQDLMQRANQLKNSQLKSGAHAGTMPRPAE